MVRPLVKTASIFVVVVGTSTVAAMILFVADQFGVISSQQFQPLRIKVQTLRVHASRQASS